MGAVLLGADGRPEGEVDGFVPDFAIPSFLAIDPTTGKISAFLSGSLTLPVASLVTPTDQNRVRWIDDISNPASAERGYLDVVEKSNLGVPNWSMQMVAIDQNGAEGANVIAFIQGSTHMPPTDSASIIGEIYGQALTIMGGSPGGLSTVPITAVFPFNGNIFGTPATTLIGGNYYGIINMSQFPPNGVNPQPGDHVDVIVDGSWLWSFVFNGGAWFFKGGAPRSFFSTSASTLSPANTPVAMGFSYALTRGGNYIISMSVYGAGSTSGASTQSFGIMKNGVAINTLGQFSTPSPSFAWNSGSPGVLLACNAGDTIDIWAMTNGTNATVNNKVMQIIPVTIS